MKTPKTYRKRPVVIEAMQMPIIPDVETLESIVEWVSPGLVDAAYDDKAGDFPDTVESWASNVIHLGTLEGTMKASLGDWIIRGIKGEFYPCKPDIFEATYEPAEGDR